MDFSIKDFNVRIRTIKLSEVIILYIVSNILTAIIISHLGINDENINTIIFDSIIMVYFLIASIGSRGMKEDFHSIFELGNSFRILGLSLMYFLFCQLLLIFLSSAGLYFTIKSPILMNSFQIFGNSAHHYMASGNGLENPSNILLYFIAIVIVAPISEELLFRVSLFNGLKKWKGSVFAVIVSSLIFGIGHFYGDGPLTHVMTASLFGMLMCIFFMRHDNVFMNIAVHSIGNFLVFLEEFTPFLKILTISPISTITFYLTMFSAVFVPAYIIYYAVKYDKKKAIRR